MAITPPRAAAEPREMNGRNVVPMSRLQGRPLLLLLDVDGTLAPIAQHPSLAQVPDETRRIIGALTREADVYVVLVSGRGARDARDVVGVGRVWTIGNHGAELLRPNGEMSIDPEVARYETSVASMADRLSPLVAPINGVQVENKTWTLSVHYRAADPAIFPMLRDMVQRVASELGLRVTEGKKILEVRPPVHVDKGTAIARIARDLGGVTNRASLLYAGDDVTDEDGFRYLRTSFPNAVTIHVGDEERTAAEYTFGSVEEVHDLLASVLREARQSR